MKNTQSISVPSVGEPTHDDALFRSLLNARGVRAEAAALPAVITGTLVALTGNERAPWVRFPTQPGSGAICASSIVALESADLGQPVVLMFEHGDALRPIIMGVRRPPSSDSLSSATLQVDADGEKLLVSAHKQLTLRCGKASITLTEAGKVLIEGSYVSSRSTGLHRIRGASVQLN